MIGIDRKTGQMIAGWQQLLSRIQQVMTTTIGCREKRRRFGSKIPQLLAKNMGDEQLLLAQSYAIDAFYNPINGLTDFKPLSCQASRTESGILLTIEGEWNNQILKLEVPI